MNHFFAGAAADFLGLGVAEIKSGAEELESFAEAGGGLGFDELVEFSSGVLNGVMAEDHRHPFLAAVGIDGQRDGTGLAVHRGLLEHQRLAAAGLFHLAVGKLGDFQLGGHGGTNAPQLALCFQLVYKITKRIKCHAGGRLANDGRGGKRAKSGVATRGRRYVRESVHRVVPFVAIFGFWLGVGVGETGDAVFWGLEIDGADGVEGD